MPDSLELELKTLNQLREEDRKSLIALKFLNRKIFAIALGLFIFPIVLFQLIGIFPLSRLWFAVLASIAIVVIPFAGVGYLVYFLVNNRDQNARLSSTPHRFAETYLHNTVLPIYFNSYFDSAKRNVPGGLVHWSRVMQYPHSLKVQSNSELTLKPFKKSSLKYYGTIEDDWIFESEGKQVAICEFSLQKDVSRGTQRTKLRNYGRWLVLHVEVDHDFEGESIVIHKDLYKPSVKDLEPLKLESRVFNEKYHAFTSNQREARVCWKTNVLSKLIDFESYGDKNFVEFRDKHVIIGSSFAGGFMDLDLEKEFEYRKLEEYMEVIQKLLDLANDLNINHEHLYKS